MATGSVFDVREALDRIQTLHGSFMASGITYSGQTSVDITLPERAAFSDYAPLLVICTYRVPNASDKDGIAVIKYVANTAVIAYKAGANALTGIAYDAATKVLTLSCESYITFIVIGRLRAG